jgi:hypothetical protein
VGELQVGHTTVPAIGVDQLAGSLVPRVDRGRLPRDDHEIALGARTMRALHARVGGTITARVGDANRQLLVVGTATFPAFGSVRFSEAGLGSGALGVGRLFARGDPAQAGGTYNYLLFRYPSAASKPAATAALRRAVSDAGCTDVSCVLTDLRPLEIDGFRHATGVPIVVGGVLALLFVATLAHALLGTLRRRRGDFAILRTLGCVRAQLVATMRWQALSITVTALAVGIPIGLLASAVAWRALTRQLGVEPGTTWPVAALALGALGALLLGTALALVASARVQRAASTTRLAS